MGSIWLARGKTHKERYPDYATRRRIYKSSLTPSAANLLIDAVHDLRLILVLGFEYAKMDLLERFHYISASIEKILHIPSFALVSVRGVPSNTNWRTILQWWLMPEVVSNNLLPSVKKIPKWHDFVNKNFIYRATWGLGSVLSLLFESDDLSGDPIECLNLNDWTRSGLPWSAFWLKDLLSWGTSDPVVAFLLARKIAPNRASAAVMAAEYHLESLTEYDVNERLNPSRVNKWVESRFGSAIAFNPPFTFYVKVTLERDVMDFSSLNFAVFPSRSGVSLIWRDQSGYIVARSHIPEGWSDDLLIQSYMLNVSERFVRQYDPMPENNNYF